MKANASFKLKLSENTPSYPSDDKNYTQDQLISPRKFLRPLPEEEPFKNGQLIIELNSKNEEIVNLKTKITALEKTRNHLIMDIENYEHLILNLEEKHRKKESDYLNKLTMAELENNNLKNQLQSLGYSRGNLNLSENMLRRENSKLRDDLIIMNQRLDYFYYFFNDLQNILLDKTISKTLLHSINQYDLEKKFYTIFEEIFKLKNNPQSQILIQKSVLMTKGNMVLVMILNLKI